MSYTLSMVNEDGLQEINEFLITRHKRFLNRPPTLDMLNAWAADAEANGNFEECAPFIEIPANKSVSGHDERFQVSPAGFEVNHI